jgi:heat-inducible transcriptional repressor
MTAGEENRAGSTALDERQIAVLRSVIRAHIRSGNPVGSTTVARGARLRLSPASIRSIMSELEELGLLAQPHTSAGRVPTDRAYRHYVDRMIGTPQVAAAQARAIDAALDRSRGEIAEMLGEASRQLSQLSHQVGLVLAPDMGRIIVEHLEFVRLDARRVVAILVGRAGLVHNRILELDRVPDQDELERIGRYLSDEFGGMPLERMRDALRQRLREERAIYDRLVAASLDLGHKAVEAEASAGELFVEGASNLLHLPEFADLDVVRTLFRALEEKRVLIDLLGRVLEGEGIQVVIGEENPLSDLARCSLVASNYGSAERPMGTVGIVGPTRMEYPRAMALVSYLAGALSRLLVNTEN